MIRVLKIAIFIAFIGMNKFAYADVRSELNLISQDLLIACKNEDDYRPIKNLNNFLNDSKGSDIHVYDLMFIFNSDFLLFIKDKNCALAASKFSANGISIKEKYFKDKYDIERMLNNEVYRQAGYANLIEYSWTMDNQKLQQAQENFNIYLNRNIISKNEKSRCGELCKDYVYLKEDHGFYLPLHYVGILMAYHDLFQHHYKNLKKTEQQITQLQEIFDLTNDFEIKYIKKTGLNSFPFEVASIENFKLIFKIDDRNIKNIFYAKLDAYIKYRIENNLLDDRMIENIYEILSKESRYLYTKVEYLGTHETKSKSVTSYQLGQHIYSFIVSDNKLKLIMEPINFSNQNSG
ncbi:MULTISPECIES: hypothetical protein [unclassified Acinetobacter]|nr:MULTISPECIES: hypothetical protein [unclassified Acinetobacter]KEC82933.1 hypothetical protein DT74_19655 [Acinetobacter sp. ETR1]WEE41619.1 hypothetical protein PYV58_10775 [Acinetobacter sp. TAC-1]